MENARNTYVSRQTEILRNMCTFYDFFLIFCRHVNIGPQYQADLASVAGKLDAWLMITNEFSLA